VGITFSTTKITPAACHDPTTTTPRLVRTSAGAHSCPGDGTEGVGIGSCQVIFLRVARPKATLLLALGPHTTRDRALQAPRPRPGRWEGLRPPAPLGGTHIAASREMGLYITSNHTHTATTLATWTSGKWPLFCFVLFLRVCGRSPPLSATKGAAKWTRLASAIKPARRGEYRVVFKHHRGRFFCGLAHLRN
jgi:hypothetical protein